MATDLKEDSIDEIISRIDFDWLSQWVNPAHLERQNIELYRRASISHPGRLLTIPNFFREEIAVGVLQALCELRYERLYAVYGDQCFHELSESEWLAAGDDQRFFRYCRAKGIPAELNTPNSLLMALSLASMHGLKFSERLVGFTRFYIAFSNINFSRYFACVTGVSSGLCNLHHVHAFEEGDFLQRHNDDTHRRRIGVVAYFSPEWKAEFGGSLRLYCEEKTFEIIPQFNTIVLFDVLESNGHSVEPVRAEACGRRRLSVSGNMLEPECPPAT